MVMKGRMLLRLDLKETIEFLFKTSMLYICVFSKHPCFGISYHIFYTICDVAKLSFNFNYNLIESWDGYILNFTHLDKYGMTSASTATFYYNFKYNF